MKPQLVPVILGGRRGVRPFDPIDLFTGGVQGAWYAPDDFSTLFQDSAGTTPVTAVEQPVGLMLDKSQGLVLGSELITNGDFSGGTTTGWTPTSATISVVSGQAELVSTVNGTFQVNQQIAVTAGRFYRFSATLRRGTCPQPVYIGFNGGGSVSTNSTTDVVVTAIIAATSSPQNVQIYTTGASIGQTLYFDNISVRELPGNHASQATAASRPVLRARYNLLTYSEDYTNAIWTKGGTATAPSANSLTFPAVNDYVWQQISPAASYAGKQVTGSVLLSGSGTVAIGYYDNVSAFQTDVITLTATPTRYTVTKTIGAGAVDVRFIVAGRIGAATATAVTANQAQVVFGSSAGTYQQITTATSYATAGFAPYLAPDGTDDFLGAAYVQSAYPLTIAAGINNDATIGGAYGIVAINQSDASYKVLRDYGAPVTDAQDRNALQLATATISLTGNKFALSQFETALITHQINAGTATTTANTNAFGTSSNIFIGKTRPAGLFSPARIYGVVVTNSVLSAAQVASLRSWMGGKMGVTL